MPSSTSFQCSMPLTAVIAMCPIADDARSPTTSRTQGDAGVKKTQLGPGSHHGEATWGAAVRWGNRPACRSFTGRPGESDAALRGHRRPACVEAATQPRDGCAAGMGKEPGRRAHSRPEWCPRAEAQRRIALGVPTYEPASGERCSTPRPAHAAGRRLSLVERRRESRARSVRPLRVGDGPSRFLGRKRWKKPETASIIARTTDRMEGPGRGNRPTAPESLTATRQQCDGTWTAPSSAICRRSAPGAATSAAAPGSAPPEPD